MLASLGIKGAAHPTMGHCRNNDIRAASILANDTTSCSPCVHVDMMHLRCGTFDTAGITLAGGPLVVAGYNGSIAWGMTMVMADNQDLFLEQLQMKDGHLHYCRADSGSPPPNARRPSASGVKTRSPG